MTGDVQVLDTVELPQDRVAGFLALWRVGYLPAAQARGLRLERVWQSCTGADTTAITILWSLPGPHDFYRMRSAAKRDPGVAEFWAAVDEMALRRDRRALQPVDEGSLG